MTTPAASDLLVLTALACAPESGLTRAKLRIQVQDLVAEDLDQPLARLEDQALIVRDAGARAERFALSTSGRSALEAAGLRLPRGAKWTAARDQDLPHLALGLPLSERPHFAKAAYLTVAVVWVACPPELGVRAGGPPPHTTGALMDRLILPLVDRLALGPTLLRRVPSGDKVTLALVQRVLLAALLGRETLPTTPAAGLGLVAARALGASSTKASDLRKALLRRWARGEPPVQRFLLPRMDPGSPAPALDHLEDFAAAVLAAGRRVCDGSAGPDRVYIIDAWHALQAAGRPNDLDLGGFKARLLEANGRRLLTLSRADVVEVLSQDKLRASEIDYLTTNFHFLELPPATAVGSR